jgi:TRAP-type C4-dicarboxylate transport system permease small subunit
MTGPQDSGAPASGPEHPEDDGAVRLLDAPVRLLGIAAGVALLAMLALIVGNILLRVAPWTSPFHGTVELVGLLAALVSGLALGAAQRNRAHVALDVVMARTPVRVQLLVGGLVAIASAVLFGLLAWRMWLYGMNLRDVGASTEAMRLEIWPVPVALAVGMAGLALALATDLSQAVRRLVSREPRSLW